MPSTTPPLARTFFCRFYCDTAQLHNTLERKPTMRPRSLSTPLRSAAQQAAAASTDSKKAAATAAGPAASSAAALQAALAAEASLDEQERALMQRAAALERQVMQHKSKKAAILEQKKQAEEAKAAEEALDNWQAELRRETDVAIARLNEQRQSQLTRCTQFEAQLQANIEAMTAMQVQVRRRAVALDTSFDAAVQRLSVAYADAVATRRGQQAGNAGAVPVE